uniref:Uncharacterized conserved protein, contains HEPN domain n=1 Tax=Candidatus Kentrum sp. UNK TaxID=2126344 RepID=A0A451B604_9GAMM|nr:MAG: Uncharacterized conserved protein, contains HEPN domain [Candidatus Kentron sp. UNK]VFK73702.1 MAG: Uncharacterized conserved protein, contains HEPN domain [Candidatus Kentron sp. UNK]
MPRDMAYLMDILTSIRLIESYTKGVAWEEFSRNTQLQDSVIRRMEIIGEAARRVSPRMREDHPRIPWTEMIGMRNRMIHEYDDIDLPIVWNTIQQDVPALRRLMEPLLPDP